MPDVRVVTARPHRLLRPLIRRIGELHREGKPCILFVPEQFTLQAERELLEQLNLKGLFSIEVVSPTRLKHRVTASAGTDERAPISPAGQQMAVSFALEACAEQLSLLPRVGIAPRICTETGGADRRYETRRPTSRRAGRLRANPSGGECAGRNSRISPCCTPLTSKPWESGLRTGTT